MIDRKLTPLLVIGEVRTGNHLAQKAEGAVVLAQTVKAEDVKDGGMIVNGPVLGGTGEFLSNAPDVFAHGREGGSDGHDAIRGFELFGNSLDDESRFSWSAAPARMAQL